MFFAEFSLQGKPKPFLLPSFNFSEFFLDGNWEGERQDEKGTDTKDKMFNS